MLAHWMGVSDANALGTIHGGTVMKLVDEVAAIAALRHARRPAVTVGVDRMTFLVPIHVGELATFSATVNAAWRTSMEVGVRVEAENPRTGEVRHTSTAYVTMVALGDDGRPVPIPPLVPGTGHRAAPGAGGASCAARTGWPNEPRSRGPGPLR